MPTEPKYTDEMILNALEECMKEVTVPSLKIAKKLDASQEHIKNRLKKIMETPNSPIRGEIISGTWCFGPVKTK